MQYINGLKQYKDNRRAAVTFGKFDGLHQGHQMLIRTVKELSSEKDDAVSVVCAFDMHQENMLMTKEERKLHLEDEVDFLVDCAFTEEFRNLSAEEFIRNIVSGVFHAEYVVVGTDFRFGFGKRGDIHMLRAYAAEYGYELLVIEKKRYCDRIISSTYIKERLKDGAVADANRMLGYRFGIMGVVERGKQLGRTLGFPTFNVLWPEEKLVPPKGVYLCRVYVDGRGYNGIANIGVKPTVSDEDTVRIESFLFGYRGNAYGKEVMIELIEYVRAEQKFRDKGELKEYVDRDIDCGIKYFGSMEGNQAAGYPGSEE